MRPAVFLDRDGVISEEGGAYVRAPGDLHLLPGAAAAIRRLTDAGWPVLIVTNQAGVGKGLMTEADLAAIHASLQEQVAAEGGVITAVYACTHRAEDSCKCRKPLPGMILTAAAEHDIDPARSWLVGDAPRDIAAGKAAGCRTVLVLTGKTTAPPGPDFPLPLPDLCVPTITEASSAILSAR